MADTLVRVTDESTQVVVEGSDLLAPLVAAAQGSVEDAAYYAMETQALMASAAALALAASVGIAVDTTFSVRPEDYDNGTLATDATTSIEAAILQASLIGGKVLFAGRVYWVSHEIRVLTGVRMEGPRSAVVKLINQQIGTLISGFTSGTTAKSFKLSNADAAKFKVGMSGMWANTATHAFSPNDSYSHAGRQISAINDNGDGTSTVTVAAGPTVSAHAAGDFFATTAHVFLLQGGNVLDGFTIDLNEANQTYAHWINTVAVVQEGNSCVVRSVMIQNTPSDAVLIGGPLDPLGEIYGSWVVFCDFYNIGGNGVHYSYARDFFVVANRMLNGNMRQALPEERGGAGGAPAGRNGHQDGAVTYSLACYGVLVTANQIRNWICGVSVGVGTVSTSLNDNVSVVGNEILECQRPVEVLGRCKRVTISGNRFRASFPFGTGANRWAYHSIWIDIGSDTVRPQLVTISGANIFTNMSIVAKKAVALNVSGNSWDNRAMGGAGNTSLTANGAMYLENIDTASVKGNMVLGGYLGVWITNQVGATAGNDISIEGNFFLHQYQTGVSGTATSAINARLRGNTFAARAAAKQEDDATALTFAANWSAFNCLLGFEIEDNRVDYDIATSISGAINTTNAIAAANRRRNKFNGQTELLPAYANDAGASAGNVKIGTDYWNTTVGASVQRRA